MALVYHNGLVYNLLNQEGNCLFSPNNCFSFFKSAIEGCDESIQWKLKYLFSWEDDKYATSFDLYDHQLKKQSKFFGRQESKISTSIKNNLEKLGCIIEDFDIENPDSIQTWLSIKHIKNCFESPSLINDVSLNIDWDKNSRARSNKKNSTKTTKKMTLNLSNLKASSGTWNPKTWTRKLSRYL